MVLGRKRIAGWTAALLALLLLTGCAAQGGSAGQTTAPPAAAATTAPPTAQQKELTLLSFGKPSEGQMEALSAALAEAGLPVTVHAGAVDEKSTAAMLKSYTDALPEADIAVFYDYGMLSQMYDRGLLLDLASYRDSYPALFSAVSDADWTAVRRGGALMGYPLPDTADVLQRQSSVMLRGDILQTLGAEAPASPEELLDLCAAARDAGLPCDLVISVQPPYAFHRTYADWPFFVSDNSLVLIGQDGQARSYPESEIFERDTALYARFREEGVLRALYDNRDIDAFCSKWDALAALFAVAYSDDCPYKDDLILVQFEPERGNIRISPNVFRFVGVSASADPETALRFLEALYTVPDVYDALAYGVKGRDWTENDDGTAAMKEVILFGRYYGVSFMEHLPAAGEETVKTARFPADTLVDFSAGAYSYAPDMNALTRIYSSTGFLYPDSGIFYIRDGSLPAERLPQAVKSLRDAGLDKIVEGYQAGYDAAAGR